MKVLYYEETKKYVRIEFEMATNGVVTIDKIKLVDCLWEATAFNKPIAINVFNLIYASSCYELSIKEIPNNNVL